jgi:peptidoglycan hydrolase-like protein with peptidoglycan-binding domain/DNA invertase Pin-like site-specific DNA recombinase
MQLTYAAPRARLGPGVLAIALAVGLLAGPSPGHAAEAPAMASAGWHGRAIQDPRPRPRLARTAWPEGWSAGPVALGTGFVRPGGSDRVRDVQRRLVQLGYRPGPVDGLFGPRTRAAVRWFQYKHGLATAGRVNRWTLAVLHARSDHEPLRAERRPRPPETAEAAPAPATTPAPAPADSGGDYTALVIALLLAVGLGVLTGLLGPELRRALRTVPEEPQAPAVLGYTAGADANAAAQAISRRCAGPGWSLVEVVQDGNQPDRRLAERRGIVYALRELRKGTAQGLVVSRLREVAPRVAELATLLHWLQEANAFLAAADHDLDTSTEQGRATARAIVELGAWERRNISQQEREDLANGRFAPRAAPSSADLAEQLAAMLERGIPPRAVTDALVLAGLATTTREEERRM